MGVGKRRRNINMKTPDEIVNGIGNRNDRISMATSPALMKLWVAEIQRDAIESADKAKSQEISELKEQLERTSSCLGHQLSQNERIKAYNAMPE